MRVQVYVWISLNLLHLMSHMRTHSHKMANCYVFVLYIIWFETSKPIYYCASHTLQKITNEIGERKMCECVHVFSQYWFQIPYGFGPALPHSFVEIFNISIHLLGFFPSFLLFTTSFLLWWPNLDTFSFLQAYPTLTNAYLW